MRRLTPFLLPLAALALAGRGPLAAQSYYFDDVRASSPYYWKVEQLRLRGISNGCSLGPPPLYCVNGSLTRQQMAKLLILTLVSKGRLPSNFAYPTTPYFTDVPPTVGGAANEFFRYVQKVRELNITAGCTTTTYCPHNNVVNWQMALFVSRALDMPNAAQPGPAAPGSGSSQGVLVG